MEIPQNVKKHGLSAKSTSCSIIKSSSSGNWIVRDRRSGRIIDKNAVTAQLQDMIDVQRAS